MNTNQNNPEYERREMTPLRSAPLGGETVPREILLAPWGRVESTNGDFVVDEESVRLTIEAFETHGTDLPIDYEHQTLGGRYAAPDGKAPAAGWIKRLFAKPDVGLLADIEWTPQAQEVLGARAYRYLSPVAIVRKSDRKLVAIHSAALTNKPAIVNMTPIVNRRNAAARPESEPLSALRATLGLAEDAAPSVVLVAAGERISELHETSARQHVANRIREAIRTGKLVEAQRAWAEQLVAREEGLFDEWLRTAPVIVMPGRTAPPAGDDVGQTRREIVTARARGEFTSTPALSGLTSVEAFINDALREAGLRA